MFSLSPVVLPPRGWLLLSSLVVVVVMVVVVVVVVAVVAMGVVGGAVPADRDVVVDDDMSPRPFSGDSSI